MSKTPDPSLGVHRVVLRPCPFCGMDDVTMDRTEYESEFGYAFYEVACGRCDIEGPGGFTEQEAADRWNRRNKLRPELGT